MLEFLGADLGNLDTVTDCYGSFCDNFTTRKIVNVDIYFIDIRLDMSLLLI